MTYKHDFKVDDRVKYGETHYRGVVTRVTPDSVSVVWGHEPNPVEYSVNSSGWRFVILDKPEKQSWYGFIFCSKTVVGPFDSEELCLKEMPSNVSCGHEFMTFKDNGKKYIVQKVASLVN